ncbi:MAG: sialate O-acetylesterase, partial [Chitinophagaceae bacterium]|nr:sialate O-acetylesterase [Chitinophagaceae bacterium]
MMKMDTLPVCTRIRTAKHRWHFVVLGWLLLAYPAANAFGQLRLPRLVSSGMVLAHGQPVPVWGWAAAGQSVAVHWQQQVHTTVANAEGRWQLMLPASKAGGPFSMRIVAEKEIVLPEVWVGEVWLCSGQSNMEQAMNGRLKYRYANYVQQAQYPQIRQYLVPDVFRFDEPATDLPAGEWLPAQMPHIQEFTAVGYFFALERWQKTGRPIGIINASLGGSPAEAWIAEDSLRSFADKWKELQQVKDSQWVAGVQQREQAASAAWWQQLQASDIGAGWQQAPVDASWKLQTMPAMLHAANGWSLPGVLWMKKKFWLSQPPAAGTGVLELGRIVESDSVWINGRWLGHTTYQYPARRYELDAASLLRAGENEIAIRMVANGREGGMVPDKLYELRWADTLIDLKGDWWVKQSAAQSTPAPATTFWRWKPAGLYNGMMAPMANYGLTGVLWYQGESNAAQPANYARLMRTLIGNWRQQFQRPDLPFLYVQLPAFLAPADTVQERSNWAAMRQQQAMVLQVPHTAMAGIFDLGEWNDIHPENKLDVGKRLAALAVALLEKGDTAAGCGPLLQSWQYKRGAYRLQFRFAGSR